MDKAGIGTLYHIAGQAIGVDASTMARMAYREARAHEGYSDAVTTAQRLAETMPKSVPTREDAPQYTSYPPGMAGRVAQWLEQGNPVANPAASIGSVLAFSAALCGRTWTTGGAVDDGINLYVCLLCPSGGGKEWMWSGLQRLVVAAGLRDDVGHIISPQPASEPSLADTLSESPSTVIRLSEVGLWLQRILSSRGSGPEKGIELALLDLYSRAQRGSVYQAARRTKEERKTISEPSVSVFGDSTLTSIYLALSDNAAQSGLVGRFLFLEAPIGQDRYTASLPDMPSDIEAATMSMAQHWTRDHPAVRHAVAWSDEAMALDRARFERWSARKASSAEHVRLVYNRVRQTAKRVAANLALWDCPNMPCVGASHVVWAWDEAERSAAKLLAAYESGEIQSSHAAGALEILADYCLAKVGVGGIIERRAIQSGIKRRLQVPMERYSAALRETLADAIACGVLAPVPREQRPEQAVGEVYLFVGPPGSA